MSKREIKGGYFQIHAPVWWRMLCHGASELEMLWKIRVDSSSQSVWLNHSCSSGTHHLFLLSQGAAPTLGWNPIHPERGFLSSWWFPLERGWIRMNCVLPRSTGLVNSPLSSRTGELLIPPQESLFASCFLSAFQRTWPAVGNAPTPMSDPIRVTHRSGRGAVVTVPLSSTRCIRNPGQL